MIEEQYSRKEFESLSVGDLASLLTPLEKLISKRIIEAVSSVQDEDDKRSIYYAECDQIIEELNALGHKLEPFDQDNVRDFQSCSVSYGTSFISGVSHGLDIEFFPSSVSLQWVTSANA